MDEGNRFISFMNTMFSNNPNFFLSGVSLIIKDRNSDEEFGVEINVDPAMGRLEATVDPDFYIGPEYNENENELLMLHNADGFELNIEATRCISWGLVSRWGSHKEVSKEDNPVEVLEGH